MIECISSIPMESRTDLRAAVSEAWNSEAPTGEREIILSSDRPPRSNH